MNFQVVRRDSTQIQATFTDSSGNAIDITGGTVFFTVKKNLYDADADAVISKDITSLSDPTNGIAAIDLTSSDTDIQARQYHYDVQLLLGSDIVSSERGLFYVLQDVTVRTS